MYVVIMVFDRSVLRMSRYSLVEGCRCLTDVNFRGVTLLCVKNIVIFFLSFQTTYPPETVVKLNIEQIQLKPSFLLIHWTFNRRSIKCKTVDHKAVTLLPTPLI